jgi:FKBP-type peptidyl-prolyl cis-trans isomerase (trigger factor)
MTQQQTQAQQIPDVDLTFKLAFIDQIMKALDEVPHKYVRGVIDALGQQIQQQIQAQQVNTVPGSNLPK